MKKTIFLMLGMAAMLASCSQDELDGALGSGTAVITATVDDGIATRSTYDNDDVDITRCLLEVRDGEGNLVGKQHETTKGTDDTYTFTVRGLDPEAEYTYAFWADNGSAYDAKDLTNVMLIGNSGDVALAFSGTTTGKPGEISAELTHAVAKITLKTTGSLAKGDIVYISTGLALNTLNVLTGEVENDKSLLASGGTIIEEDIPAEGGEVMTIYMPMPADGQTTDVTIDYICAETGNMLSKTMTNVPLRANYRTLISGDIGNIGATDLTATISKDGWNDNEGAQLVTSVIKLETAGTLTDEMIGTAITQNAGYVTIEGKINKDDIKTLRSYFIDNEGGDVTVDMSRAFLDDTDTEWTESDKLYVKGIAFPEGLTSISDYAYTGPWELKSVKFPSTLTTIGSSAFINSGVSGELVIPKNVIAIGNGAFMGASITSLVWNTDLNLDVGFAGEFGYNDNLKTVTINGNIQEFNISVFAGCNNIESITFSGVTDVPKCYNSETLPAQTKIYVPANLVEAFQAAEGWSDYAGQIQAIE